MSYKEHGDLIGQGMYENDFDEIVYLLTQFLDSYSYIIKNSDMKRIGNKKKIVKALKHLKEIQKKGL